MSEILAPLEWYTEKRVVSQLIPYEYNPRKRTPERIQKLKESLEKFNLVEIPAINLDNTIIAGHQRVFALFEIGRGNEEIDVRVPNRKLTEEELKEYNIRSNIGIGEWDIDLLIEHFSEFDFDSLGLDLDFELPDDLKFGEEAEEDFEPEMPEEPRTVEGDVYELHSKQKGIVHRIVCGDSTDAAVYEKLLPNEKLDLVNTDPPYNVDYEGGTKEKLKIKNDKMASGDFYTMLYLFLQETFIRAVEGTPIYMWHADTEGENFRKALRESGWKLSQCLVWVKNSLVMGRNDYHWRHEPCLYGWKPGAAHPWYSDRKQSTVLEFDKPLRNDKHPTMKPLELIIYQIKNSSKQKDLVGDPFLGSGTALICCEQTWRMCRGVELDPRWVDVSVDRWVKYMNDNGLDYELKLNGKTIEWHL